jgi:hypothetical protein
LIRRSANLTAFAGFLLAVATYYFTQLQWNQQPRYP